MPVRLCFEKKKILLFGYIKEKKITAIGLNSDIFHLILIVHCCLHFIMQINITFRRFKENLA